MEVKKSLFIGLRRKGNKEHSPEPWNWETFPILQQREVISALVIQKIGGGVDSTFLVSLTRYWCCSCMQ
jgi:hypothetical protein